MSKYIKSKANQTSDVVVWVNVNVNTYAHAYLDAFLLPVNSGDNSARNLMSVFTLSASPVRK